MILDTGYVDVYGRRATVRNDPGERSEASRVKDTHRFQTRHDKKMLKISRGWHGDDNGTLSVVHITLVRRKQMPESVPFPSPCHPRDICSVFVS